MTETTDPAVERMMAAARALATDFAIRLPEGMSVEEANAYFRDTPFHLQVALELAQARAAAYRDVQDRYCAAPRLTAHGLWEFAKHIDLCVSNTEAEVARLKEQIDGR